MGHGAIDVRELKKRLSAKLLSIPEVSGVGTPHGKLTVYLVDGSAEVRRKVQSLVRDEAPEADVCLEVTGGFSAF